MVELTNGLNSITSISTKSISTTIVFTSFLLGFGGISVLLQVFSLVNKSHLSIKTYILGKLLHGFLAAILTYIAINVFPIFNLDITPIFSQNTNAISSFSYNNGLTCFFVILIIVFTTFVLSRKKQHIH